jgi:hypothetical protein
LVPKAESIARSHLIPRTREACPAVFVVDGPDGPSGRCQRTGNFTIALLVRSDLGPAAAAVLKGEVVRRLSPAAGGYPNGVELSLGRIRVDTELADTDATRVDIELSFCYAAPEWTLGEE